MDEVEKTVERRVPVDWALFLSIYAPLLISRTITPFVTGAHSSIFVVITTLMPAVISWLFAYALRRRGAAASSIGASAPLLIGFPLILIDPWGGGLPRLAEAILVGASVYLCFRFGPSRSMEEEVAAAPVEEHRFVRMRRYVVWTVLVLPLLPLLPALFSTSPNAGLVLLFPPVIFVGITIPALVIIGIASALRHRPRSPSRNEDPNA